MPFPCICTRSLSVVGKGVSRLPAELTDQWLDGLPLVKVGPDSVHYTGRQLTATTRLYAGKMEQDDPVEEYKVGEGQRGGQALF